MPINTRGGINSHMNNKYKYESNRENSCDDMTLLHSQSSWVRVRHYHRSQGPVFSGSWSRIRYWTTDHQVVGSQAYLWDDLTLLHSQSSWSRIRHSISRPQITRSWVLRHISGTLGRGSLGISLGRQVVGSRAFLWDAWSWVLRHISGTLGREFSGISLGRLVVGSQAYLWTLGRGFSGLSLGRLVVGPQAYLWDA